MHDLHIAFASVGSILEHIEELVLINLFQNETGSLLSK